MSTIPERTCVGCGRKALQPALVRFVLRDGALTAGARLSGRGAYTCNARACFERAVDHGGFARAFRMRVVIDQALTRLYTEGPNG